MVVGAGGMREEVGKVEKGRGDGLEFSCGERRDGVSCHWDVRHPGTVRIYYVNICHPVANTTSRGKFESTLD